MKKLFIVVLIVFLFNSFAQATEYSQEAIDLFHEVKMESSSNQYDHLRWPEDKFPLKVNIVGQTGTVSQNIAEDIFQEFRNINPSLDFQLTKSTGDITLYFVPAEEFSDYQEQFGDTSGWWGGYWYWTAEGQHLEQGWSFVSTDPGIEDQKNILRRNLTKLLGLMKDTEVHEDSVFYKYVDSFTELDKEVINLAYDDSSSIDVAQIDVKDEDGDLEEDSIKDQEEGWFSHDIIRPSNR